MGTAAAARGVTYEIVPGRISHIIAMSRILRPGDAAELATQGCAPRHTMARLYRGSFLTRAGFVDGELAIVWGFSCMLASPEADAWLFTSHAIERAPLVFAREARREVRELLGRFHSIASAAGSDYLQSLRFWKLIGFEISDEALGGFVKIRAKRDTWAL